MVMKDLFKLLMMNKKSISFTILISLFNFSILFGDVEAEFVDMEGQVTFVYKKLENSYYLKKSTYMDQYGEEYFFFRSCGSLNQINSTLTH